MNQVEIVTLRAIGKREMKLALELLFRIHTHERTPSQPRFDVYRHNTVENDLAVHIHRPADTENRDYSPLGSWLKHMLQEYGLVNHAVWQPIPIDRGSDPARTPTLPDAPEFPKT